MTASAIIGWQTSGSPAASPEGGRVAIEVRDGYRHLCSSYAMGEGREPAFQDLFTVAEECKVDNWDGQGAARISDEAYSYAYRVIQALPIGTPSPTIGAEPDGQISLEWYVSPRRLLSVSVSAEGELHYAALIGTRKSYGTEPFFSDVPKSILDLISQIMASLDEYRGATRY